MNSQSRDFFFLLSLGAIPFACSKQPADLTTGLMDSDNLSSDLTSPNPTTTGAADTGSTFSDITSDHAATMTGPMTTVEVATDSDSEVNSDESGALPPQEPICVAYLDHLEMCFPGDPYNYVNASNCDKYLQMGLRLDGQECRDALEAAFVCLTNVGCDESPLCARQLNEAGEACPLLFMNANDTSSGSDTGQP